MVLSTLGKLCVDASFISVYVYTAELFPTEVRTSAFGTCATFGRIGSVMATFVGKELVRILLDWYLASAKCKQLTAFDCQWLCQ